MNYNINTIFNKLESKLAAFDTDDLDIVIIEVIGSVQAVERAGLTASERDMLEDYAQQYQII